MTRRANVSTKPANLWGYRIPPDRRLTGWRSRRSEEHTSELQSLRHLVCRLLLEKKKKQIRENRRGLSSCVLALKIARCAAEASAGTLNAHLHRLVAGISHLSWFFFFFFNDGAPPEIYPFPLPAPFPI